jgi:hypothetical protein
VAWQARQQAQLETKNAQAQRREQNLALRKGGGGGGNPLDPVAGEGSRQGRASHHQKAAGSGFAKGKVDRDGKLRAGFEGRFKKGQFLNHKETAIEQNGKH